MAALSNPRHERATRTRLVPAPDSTNPPDDLADLLRRSARGDTAAFEQVYDQAAGAVLGIAIRILRNEAIAEEVAQDVLVEIWRTASRHDRNRGSARTWILTIAHRRAVDRVRREQSATDRERRAASRETSRPYDDVSEQTESNLERQQIRRCLQGLTESQRQSVMLAYYGGYTYPQIARRLDRPLGTIKTRARDGIAKLRDCMTRNAA